MKKFLQLIRPFCETRNIVAICLAFFLCAGSLWAQTDYSTTYTSGVELSTAGGTSASTCSIIIEGETYPGIKAGTSSVAGAVKITVPENTKYLHIHVAGWNGKSVTMSVSSAGYSSEIALTSNSGIANNTPFTFNGDASTSDYYKVITFPEALSEETEFTFTATTGNRFVIWGVNAEEEGTTPSNNPSISAENVELDYDAASGEIEYSINNPTTDGVLTASTNLEWITDVAVISDASIVTFNTSVNTNAAQRQGTVTLTYTYGDDQTVTKNVTVVQAGNPNVVDNISDITATGTYTVQGTIVAKSQRGFVVGDGTGYVYYYNQSYTQGDYNIGDNVKLSGSVVVYGGVYEFNNTTTVTPAETSNYVAEDPTVLTGAEMDARVASTTPADLSRYVQYQGVLSINGTHYNITDIDGASTAIGSISYPLDTDFASLDGHTVIVEGYYVGISTSTYYNTMLGSITEVVSDDPSISADNVELDYDAATGEIEYTLNNPTTDGELTASSEDEWISDVEVFEDASVVTFTTTVNELTTPREGTVTLTYTYGDNQTVTKNVTVTQAGNPNVVDNISDITAAGTYIVQGTIVAKSQRGFIVGDGTGYVYYYNQNYTQEDYNIGDNVKLSGSVVVYGGVYEFNNTTTVTPAETSNYVAEDPTVLTGAEMDARVASTTPPALSTYVQYQGTLSVNGTHYNITGIDGASTAIGSISYPLDTEFASLDGHTVIVEGYYVGISTGTYYNTMLGSITEVISTDPSITVELTSIEATAEATTGSIGVTYNNMETIDAEIVWYEEDGETETEYDWITAEIEDNYGVYYAIEANEGEARTAYFKVFANDTYSELITVTQEGYVAPTVATLPFEFNGGKADIEDVDGLTQEGLGSDYAISQNPTTQLKFDGTGDWLELHFDGEPGKLSFDIKGNGFSGGTFTVQTSEDGVTYTELASYIELGGVQTVEFYTLGTDVRYIKWIYTEKASGNVGLGNIILIQPNTDPVITLEPVEVVVPAEGTTGTLTMTYLNMGEDPFFMVQFFAEDGETFDSYDWISADVNAEMNVSYSVEANDGEARTAYLKVYGLTDESEEAYSNLVTITQAAAPQQYVLTVGEFENLEIVTYVDNIDELALEGAGTITVNENATIYLRVNANEGYALGSLVVDGQSVLSQLDESGLYTFTMPAHDVTVSATAVELVPGDWVLTSLADLTENDVFVIVESKGDVSNAMTNDNGASLAPAAVPVIVVDNTLSGEPAVNIQWNLSGNTTDGYTFYPNGTTESWLYCNNSNNGVRVGTGDNSLFSVSAEGYLYNDGTGRYIGVYNNQDWRCYTTIHANIADETFAFYKKVTSPTECTTIVLNEENPVWSTDFEAEGAAAYTGDLYTGATPRCWSVPVEYFSASADNIGEGIDTLPQIYHSFNTTPGGHYSLRIHFRSLVAMPELDESVDLGKVRMSMYVRQSYWRYKLQIGIITDMDNPEESFVPVALVNNPDKNKTYFECGFSSVKDLVGAGRYIAFKNIGSSENDPYCVNYLDDIVLAYVSDEACQMPLSYEENFEDYTDLPGATGYEPDCWEVITEDVALESTTKPQIYNAFNTTEGGNYSLRMRNRCVYAMPKFTEEADGQDLTMTLNVRQPNALYRLQVGLVDEAGEFTPVKTIRANANMEEYTVNFTNFNVANRIAFRNTLVPGTGMATDYFDYSYNYLDDILVEATSAKMADMSGEMSEDVNAILDNIEVYPNPTTGDLYIEAVDVQKVECYNQMGQLVRVYDNVLNRIALDNLTEGVYMLRITVPQGVTVRKVVKK